ncbi:stonustoxin subunit beta-like, partial [Oncorhynchus masou masou]|uniref:stonustoxin subunit beta-like n=1 Tax=Oncorhynchus masou masou TaxID=90313 RepID=UPI00318306A0
WNLVECTFTVYFCFPHSVEPGGVYIYCLLLLPSQCGTWWSVHLLSTSASLTVWNLVECTFTVYFCFPHSVEPGGVYIYCLLLLPSQCGTWWSVHLLSTSASLTVWNLVECTFTVYFCFPHSVEPGGVYTIKPWPRKYACDLTLDPNTVNQQLSLTEDNRKVTRRRETQPYPDHPERFEVWKQVLCRDGLTGRCYWEVEWSGRGAYIAVTYKGISRRGKSTDCLIGLNDKSWSLQCSDQHYTARHNHNPTSIEAPSSSFHRVGVYLDWPAGTLSFYRVSSDTLTHLHTFTSTFTEPLYPGFRFYCDTSVSLCQV